MFYSQTFLARKGPLSTVWIAAHLQHRLKKSHYTATDIPSTVQHIMDPGVPIALRMSGHLLLGVVRIYSKKVDYLFHDCNVVLTGLSKAFAAIQLTLPEDARQAPVQSITLPEKFNLDALNLGDEIDLNGIDDMHLRSQEDITLADRSPIVMDHYVAISFDEDIIMDSSHTEVLPDSGERPMDSSHTEVLPDSGERLMDSSHTEVLPDSGERPMDSSHTEVLPDSGEQPMDSSHPEVLPDSGERPMNSSHTEVLADSGERPMENIVPQSPLMNAAGVQDRSPIQINEGVQDRSPRMQINSPVGDRPHDFQDPEATCTAGPSGSRPTQAMPIEVLRDANNDFTIENPPVYPDLGDNDTEPNKDIDQTMTEKDPIPETIGDLGPEGTSAQLHFGTSTPVTSQGGTQDAQVFIEHSTPNLVLRASPLIQQQPQQPQRRGRKRKQLFDEPIVLSNKFMRDALNNTRNILRKRRDVPSSTLGAWKLNNSRRKETIFDQPLLTGLCQELVDISKREYIHSIPHLLISEEDNADDGSGVSRTPPTNQILEEPRAATPPITATDMEIEPPPTNQIPEEPRAASSPVNELDVEIEHPPTNQIPEEPRAATPPVNELVMEIEHLRSIAATPPPTIPAHSVDVELNIDGDQRSPAGRDNMTPVSAHNLRSVSVSPLRPNIASEAIQTPDVAASLGTYGSEMETPRTYLDDTFQHPFSLSDTHQLINSAESEELSFLEMDNNTPASSQGTSKSTGTLSVRTRAVAQYLKAHSPISPILEDPAAPAAAGDLNLNKILEGKTRKISARMFYEVLVLKTHGLVDVHQEEPYDDISLKLMPTLTNAQI